MPAQLQRGWEFQRYVAFAYLLLGFGSAVAAGRWWLPDSVIDPTLRHADTLEVLSKSAFDPEAVRSWFALMLLLGLAWTVPTALSFARGALPRKAWTLMFLGLPLAAACLFLAWGLVDGIGLLLPVLPVPGNVGSARAVKLLVGDRFDMGFFSSLLMFVATVLASMPFAAFFILGKRRSGG